MKRTTKETVNLLFFEDGENSYASFEHNLITRLIKSDVNFTRFLILCPAKSSSRYYVIQHSELCFHGNFLKI